MSAAVHIRMALPGLNETQGRVARAVLDNGERLRDMSIGEVAELSGVSAAMVVKVAKKLGFSGFRELKASLSAYYLSPAAGLHEEIDADDDAATSVSKVFSTAIQALRETLAVVDIEKLELAAEALYLARRRNLYGVGGSGIVAEDAGHKLLRIGLESSAYSDAHLMAMSAAVLGPGDVALGVTFSGQTQIVVDTLRIAREAGATTIALSNFLNSPVTEQADIVLLSTSRGSTLTSASVAARVAQLCIIDALFVRIAQRDYVSAINNLRKTMVAVEPRRIRAVKVAQDET